MGKREFACNDRQLKLPDNDIYAISEFEAFAYKLLNVYSIHETLSLDRKHCGKKRKCWLPAFSPFPTMFFKTVTSKGYQNLSLYGKCLTLYQTIPTFNDP